MQLKGHGNSNTLALQSKTSFFQQSSRPRRSPVASATHPVVQAHGTTYASSASEAVRSYAAPTSGTTGQVVQTRPPLTSSRMWCATYGVPREVVDNADLLNRSCLPLPASCFRSLCHSLPATFVRGGAFHPTGTCTKVGSWRKLWGHP